MPYLFTILEGVVVMLLLAAAFRLALRDNGFTAITAIIKIDVARFKAIWILALLLWVLQVFFLSFISLENGNMFYIYIIFLSVIINIYRTKICYIILSNNIVKLLFWFCFVLFCLKIHLWNNYKISMRKSEGPSLYHWK